MGIREYKQKINKLSDDLKILKKEVNTAQRELRFKDVSKNAKYLNILRNKLQNIILDYSHHKLVHTCSFCKEYYLSTELELKVAQGLLCYDCASDY